MLQQLLLKKKTSTCGSQVSHIWIALWVSGSNGSTGATHFQSWIINAKEMHYIGMMQSTTLIILSNLLNSFIKIECISQSDSYMATIHSSFPFETLPCAPPLICPAECYHLQLHNLTKQRHTIQSQKILVDADHVTILVHGYRITIVSDGQTVFL